MLTVIIWSLIWFFLAVGVAAVVITIILFFMARTMAPALFYSQVILICFVIVLAAAIGAKAVGL